jgi:hypothetical protein
VAAHALVAAAVLADLVRAYITWPLPARMALSAGVVLVFGLAMGLMLPLGVRLLAARDPSVVPWGWGVNGGTSVIGTVGATVIAINAGYTATFVVGAAVYALAGALGYLLSRAALPAGAAPPVEPGPPTRDTGAVGEPADAGSPP